MISFQIRYRIAQIKYWWHEKLPLFVAYLIPRKIALLCFVRVFSVLSSYSDDYDSAYKMFESGKGK